ncbi:MAG: MerR family transcriptional regulator [Variibacter sp.]|nr:MerR family transcriptional regulator [Variibacter sp.]
MDKAPDAFRTISEVAEDLDVPQHVLRFWETRFPQIRPMKRGGGRRYYRPDDVELLRGIRHLLYGEGYTIRGVQRILKEEGIKFVQGVWKQGAPQSGRARDGNGQGRAGAAAATAEAAEPLDAPEAADADDDGREAQPAGVDDDGHEDGRDEVSVAPRPRVCTDDAERAQDAAAASEKASAASAGLTAEDLRRLQAALSELAECRRILESVLKDAD